jgi:hypothetical protein
MPTLRGKRRQAAALRDRLVQGVLRWGGVRPDNAFAGPALPTGYSTPHQSQMLSAITLIEVR